MIPTDYEKELEKGCGNIIQRDKNVLTDQALRICGTRYYCHSCRAKIQVYRKGREDQKKEFKEIINKCSYDTNMGLCISPEELLKELGDVDEVKNE